MRTASLPQHVELGAACRGALAASDASNCGGVAAMESAARLSAEDVGSCGER
jgi:hypothetical protein